jgi:hypothetical protein
MKGIRAIVYVALVMFGASMSSGCIIVSEETNTSETCYDDCYDYEVCETYCDAWECWDECWWETSCTTYCEEEVVVEEEEVIVEEGAECYSDLDCGEGKICVADQCQARDTDERGLAGLCQSCETNQDCVEDGSLCIRLNFDQATTTGEKVCTRPCEYNHECPAGFECINISSEVGTSPQCLPVLTEFEKRTCNPSPEPECVRASDCSLGESCVANECVAPDNAECSDDNPCADGEECRNFECVPADQPECVDRSDCQSGEICIDGSCTATAESCVFNEECDDGMCVDGTCLSSCSEDSECANNERCRQGLCEPLECRRSADCDAGSICVDARCEQTCDADSGAGCDDGYLCNDHGYCEADPNVECRSNAECGRDEICQDGSCTTPCSCNQQCSNGEVCNLDTGLCEDPAANEGESCQDDCDCPAGESCNANGVCE